MGAEEASSPVVPSVSAGKEHLPEEAIGIPRQKRFMEWIDLAAITASFACLALSIAVVVRPEIAHSLEFKHQIQVLGVLLAIMNISLRVILPKHLMMMEARYGPSCLQNFDAILRNSVVASHMSMAWRIVLLGLIILPTGLNVAYQQFVGGTVTVKVISNGGNYGLSAPGNLSILGAHLGLAMMANASLPFVEATHDDSVLLGLNQLPKAYGFNVLMLSNTSVAYIDIPMPEYVLEIQRGLSSTSPEITTLTADVRGLITTYNSTAENHRNDTSFWEPILSPNASANAWQSTDLFNGHHMALAVASYGSANASSSFTGFTDTVGDHAAANKSFMAHGLGFDTRRDLCRGTWVITNVSLQLLNGSCTLYSLNNLTDQAMVTNTIFAFTKYYPPMLAELLGPFATDRNQSQWLVPSFAAAIGGMYWSRLTAEEGGRWGKPDSGQNVYPVEDSRWSTRSAIYRSWLLYLVLATQPVLTLLSFATTLIYSQVPIDSGFGMLAILSGVKAGSLKLLEGASLSGHVERPVRLEIDVNEASLGSRSKQTTRVSEVAYTIGGTRPNDFIPQSSIHHRIHAKMPTRLGYFKKRLGDVGQKIRHGHATDYEMLPK